MALCSRCTYPNIHFFVSRSRSVVWCVVCFVGVGVGVWSWWCCVLCGWCVSLCSCVVLLFFSQLSSFSFFLSLFLLLSLSSLFFPSSLFSLLSSLPLPLLSSLLATKHCGKNRSTNTAANFEAFECDLAHGRCTAVGSLPPSLNSLLPSLPLLLKKKKEETFYYRNISGE